MWMWFVLLQILCQYRYAGGQLMATKPPDLSERISGYTIKTDRPFRDTVYQTGDYACGRVNFCNSSIAKHENGHCFDCKRCKCDEKCSYFGDCCPDLLFRDSAQTSAKSSPHVSCEKRYPKWRKFTEQPYLFMVTKCPNDYEADDSVKIKCEKTVGPNFEQGNQVSDVKTQLTYRNKFCAICHGVTVYQLWELRVECGTSGSMNSASDKNELWKMVLDNPTCKFGNSPPNDVDIRTCFGDSVKTCSLSWKLEAKSEYIETLCGMYSHPVKLGNQFYKNVFCAVCNGQRLNRNEPCISGDMGQPVERTYPLSVLIDFNSRPELLSEAESLQEVEKKCNVSETNNPFSGQCEKLKCPPRRILSDGFCETFYSSTKSLGYSFSMVVKFSEKLDQSDWSTITALYQERLRQEFVEFRPFVFSPLEMRSFRKANTIIDEQGRIMFSEEITGMNVSVRMVSTSSLPVLALEERIKAVQSFSFSMDIRLKNVTLTSIPVVCSKSLQGLSGSESGPAFAVADHSRELNCVDNCLASVVYEPAHDTLDCPYLEFNLSTSNFTFHIDNSSLVFNNQTIYLNTSGYEICGDNLKLCSTVLQHIQKEIADSDSDRHP